MLSKYGLSSVIDFLENYDWASEELMDSVNDGTVQTKYYIVNLPHKTPYNEAIAEYIARDENDYIDFLNIISYIPNIMAIFYLERKIGEEDIQITYAYFDIGCDELGADITTFINELTPTLKEKILKDAKEKFI